MNRIPNKDNLNDLDYWDGYYKTGNVNKSMDNRLAFYNIIVKWLEPGQKTFLEIGCATGYGLELLAEKYPGYTFDGYDFSPVAIGEANKSNKADRIKYLVHNIYEDKIEKHYDYIGIIETLEHMENPDWIIEKCMNHCEKLIITVPYKKTCLTSAGHIITDFTRESFEKFGIILQYEVFGLKSTNLNNKKLYYYMGVMLEVK